MGLAGAAAGFCREVSSRQGVEIDFHFEDVPRELTDEVALSLFRVLQEALQNAIKHSGSRHFRVSLSGDGNKIELTVQDLGIGFEPEVAVKGQDTPLKLGHVAFYPIPLGRPAIPTITSIGASFVSD